MSIPLLSVKEIILSMLSLTVKEIILLVLSINCGGVVSTNTVHQGFFFVADVTVLFYLVHLSLGL